MGIDLLDLTFEIEKKHQLFMSKGLLATLVATQEPNGTNRNGMSRMDYSVGRFYDAFRQCLHHACSNCRRKNGKVVDNVFICDRCGNVLARGDLSWEDFCEHLATVVCPKQKIERATWLIADLGFS